MKSGGIKTKMSQGSIFVHYYLISLQSIMGDRRTLHQLSSPTELEAQFSHFDSLIQVIFKNTFQKFKNQKLFLDK